MDEYEKLVKISAVNAVLAVNVMSRLVEMLVQKGQFHEADAATFYAQVAERLGETPKHPEQHAAEIARDAAAKYAARAAAKAPTDSRPN